VAEASAGEVKDANRAPRQEKVSTWRSRYTGSATEDLFKRLGALDFANWILIFGASLLLTILPIILLLSSLASVRVDDDLARHLDLSRPGSVVFDGLFKSAPVRFDSGFVLSLYHRRGQRRRGGDHGAGSSTRGCSTNPTTGRCRMWSAAQYGRWSWPRT